MFYKFRYNILLLTFVSVLIIFMQNGEINRDGILYLTQSQFILEGNWTKAMSLYNWPFFSILIAGVHSVLGLSLQNSAHFINILLFILASFFFLKCVDLVSRNKTPFIFATIILLTSIPVMDDYLAMILRDQGQWAGFMMGVYCYLRWIKSPLWSWAVLWQIGFILGSLFRPECLLFNFLLPFTSQLLFKNKNCLKLFIQSIIVPMASLIFLPFFLFILKVELSSLELARLNELISRPQSFFNTFTQPLSIETDNYYLKVLIADFAISFKYFFLSYVVIYKWAAGLGFLHLGLFIYSIKERLITDDFFKALAVFILFSTIITVINLYTTFVIANRYWAMNFWIVYIFAAIGLGHLWEKLKKSKHPKKSWLIRSSVAILLVYFINVVIDKTEIHYEQEAGLWVKSSQLDTNNIYFSSKRAAYYSGLLGADMVDLKTATDTYEYQYLMITYNRFTEVEEISKYKPIKYFPSVDKPKVIFYKRIAESY